MNRIINPLFILLLFVCSAFSQQEKPVVLKSTITSVGSSTVVLSNDRYSVQQSIGQSGILGKVNSSSNVVQQGFLNGTRFFSINNSNNETIQERLSVIISPNPFIEFIKIDFSSKTKYSIYVMVFDTNGKLLISREYPVTKSITLPMKNISLGSYLIHLVSGEDKFVEKILKLE